jgi:SAM-dependent methyltransferase
MNDLDGLYGQEFYKSIIDDAYASAKVYGGLLAPILPTRSVVDLGCGQGAWLRALGENGAERLVGYDGPWVDAARLMDSRIEFRPCDLSQGLPKFSGEHFDLAVSLEVAEHLPASSALGFVESLVDLSDAVLFGAAWTGQGGVGHLNEQCNSYWGKLFVAHRYRPFDIFRARVWGNPSVAYWYQQNAFLYVLEGSQTEKHLSAQGILPMQGTAFMDCVHPQLYNAIQIFGFRKSLASTARAAMRIVRRWIGRRANER